MKLTATEYQIWADIKKENGYISMADMRTNGVGTDLQKQLDAENKEIDEMLAAIPTVCVACYCGGRAFYWSGIVKIGKTYYRGGEKMTQGNGYRSVKEIAKVTEEQTARMIDDSYYY